MNKILYTISLILLSSLAFAQVGIGTITPNSDALLDIDATDKGVLIPRIELTSLTSSSPLSENVAGMIVYNTATAGTTPNNVTPGFYYNDGTAWVRVGAAIQDRFNIYEDDGSLTENRTVAQGSNTLAFNSSATTGTSHFTVDNSTFNVNTINNSVGIGTSNPLGRLHVLSDDGRDAIFSAGSNDATTNMDLDIYRYRGNAASPALIQNGDNIGGVRFNGLNGAASGVVAPFTIMGEIESVADGAITPTSAPGALNFKTTTNGTLVSSTKMIIKNNGSVGIGTITPNSDALLDVDATDKGVLIPRIELTSLISSSPLSENVAGMIVYNTATAGTTPNNVTPGFYYNDGTVWVRVGAANQDRFNIYEDDGSLTENRTVTQGSNTLAFTSSAADAFSVDGQTFSVNAANDRVGIGTNNPFEKLHINGGNLRISQGSETLGVPEPSVLIQSNLNGGTAGGKIEFQEPFSQIGYRIKQFTQDAIDGLYFQRFFTSTTTDLLTLRDNGRVGIGETDPAERLEVSGNALFNNSASDFAFSRYISNDGVTSQIGSSSSASAFGAGAFIGTVSNDPLNFIANNVPVTRLTSDFFVPNGSNLVSLGSSVDRWSSIFGGTSLNMFNDSEDFVFSRFQSQGGVISQIGSSSSTSAFGAGSFVGSFTNNPINFIVDNFPVTRLNTDRFVPNGTNLIDLGSTTDRWRSVFVRNSVRIGNTPTSGNLFEGNSNLGGIELVGEADGGYISVQRDGIEPGLHVTKRTGSSGDALSAYFLNGSERGSVRLTTGGVSFNTTSDKRLKTNIKETELGLETINQIDIYDYVYKSDKTNTVVTGFLAQELHEILPQAVYKGGDDPNNDPWQVDYGSITPILVKAIQEQQAQIEALKSEIHALKSEK